MRPQRAESMSSSARRVQWKAPERLVSTTLPHSSALMRIASPSRRWPALLTSTCTGPKRSRASAKARSTASGSPTSAMTSPPVLPRATTRQPRSRSAPATAAPMPRVPPVTRAQPPSGGPPLPSRADMHALLPRDDAGAPHEAGAEGGQPDPVAGPQRTAALGLPQRERDRCRRRVGDMVDVERHAVTRHSELVGRGLDDAGVGLVGDEQIELARLQAAVGKRGPRRLDHPADGVTVDLAPLHAQQPLLGPGVEQVAVDAVAAELEGRAAEIELAARDDHGARAVPEEDRGRAVLHVGDARQRLRPADEHDVGALGLDQRRGLLQRRQEAGTGGVEVARAGAPRADQGSDLGGETRRQPIGGDRRDDHAVDGGGVAVRVVQRGGTRLGGEVGQRPRPIEPAPLADARTADDPLVAGVEPLHEGLIGDDRLGQGRADAEDPRPAHAAASAGTIRRTMPVSTRPGPTSVKPSMPAASSASTVSRQRTGRSRLSASSRRGSAKGAAVAHEYTDIAGGRNSTRANAAARRAAAGPISGEWKAPPTSSRRARAPTARACSSATPRASTRPDSTSWPGPLSLATVRPSCAARSATPSGSPPSMATMPPGAISAASAIAAARSSTSASASSKSSAPAATSAAYSPSEWPAAAPAGGRPAASQAGKS